MKTMKDFCPKPSDALQAMLDGLKEIPGPNFTVDMSSFGGDKFSMENESYNICFGCAATCATQKATGIRLTARNIVGVSSRAKVYNVDTQDLANFEDALNIARTGHLENLLSYYGIVNDDLCAKYRALGIYLETRHYHLQYNKLELAITMLKYHGL